MRICAMSDLHIKDDFRKAYVPRISEDTDLLIAAGDIASNESSFKRFSEEVDRVYHGAKVFVFGNHDFEDGGYSPEKAKRLAKLTEDWGWMCLDRGFAIIDDVGFVGNMGWYDFSFRNKEGPIKNKGCKSGILRDSVFDEYLVGKDINLFRENLVERWEDVDLNSYRRRKMFCLDGRVPTLIEYVSGIKIDQADEEFCKDQNKKLEDDLRGVGSCRKVVAVSHLLPFKLYSRLAAREGFLNSFAGSDERGEIVLDRADVVIHGHTHRQCRSVKQRDGNDVRVYGVSCFNYENAVVVDV